jgi:tetratricopeptide (TPR) repeat protein
MGRFKFVVRELDGEHLLKIDRDELALAFHDSHNPRCHYNLGNAFSRLGLIDKAIAQYRQTLQIDPNVNVLML